MKEDAAVRAAKYLDATSQSLQRLKTKKLPIPVSEREVNQVLDLVRGYSGDAKHYAERQKHVTSLACIAYAEGLLDAMKFLGIVDLENPPDGHLIPEPNTACAPPRQSQEIAQNKP